MSVKMKKYRFDGSALQFKDFLVQFDASGETDPVAFLKWLQASYIPYLYRCESNGKGYLWLQVPLTATINSMSAYLKKLRESVVAMANSKGFQCGGLQVHGSFRNREKVCSDQRKAFIQSVK